MYAKIFESIYDGTLAEDWRALITFQQMLILCDRDGIIDMTPSAISRRTGIPIEHIKAGLEILAAPDPVSRSENDEGRRIKSIDPDRPWGWVIVNYAYYRDLASRDDKLTKDRERIAAKREQARMSQDVAKSRKESRKVVNVAHVTVTTSVTSKEENTLSGKPDDVRPSGKKLNDEALAVLAFLNEKTGRKYQPVPANLKLIAARIREGATVTQLRQVVAKKCREWNGRDNMAEYLRPATLFNATKFAQYVGELGAAE